jgi:RND family efflux transporter MFP subunit
VLVGPGEHVAAGQELARIASQELETIQLDLLRASAELVLANRLLDQREDLSRRGVIPEKDLLETRAERERISAEIGTARLKLAALGLDEAVLARLQGGGAPVRELSIVTPVSGVVAAADVRAGQVVAATEHLYHILDSSRVWAVGEALESQLRGLKEGLRIEATFDALPGETFPGEVEFLALSIDEERRTLPVRATLNNDDGRLRPGMFGRMRITAERVEKAVVCPVDALVRSGGRHYVLLEEGPGQFQRHAVVLGLRMRKRVEIRDGLFPGDRVVTVGKHELASLLGDASPANRTPSATVARAKEGSPVNDPVKVIVAQARVELPVTRQAFAAANIEGRIARLLVEPGQQVAAGQVLAEVESLAVRTLQLELLQARSKRAWASETMERLQELGQEQIARKELWRVESDVEKWGQTEESLRRQLALIGLSETDIARIEGADLTAPLSEVASAVRGTVPIRAPASGWIANVDISPGQVVAPNESLFEIHDPMRMWVRAFIHEQDAAAIRLGQEVEVRLSADPEFRAKGTVTRASPILTDGNRVFSVWTEVDNPDRSLKEGMSAGVRIRVGPQAPNGRVTRAD